MGGAAKGFIRGGLSDQGVAIRFPVPVAPLEGCLPVELEIGSWEIRALETGPAGLLGGATALGGTGPGGRTVESTRACDVRPTG